jgi:copper(I)-binding protein
LFSKNFSISLITNNKGLIMFKKVIFGLVAALALTSCASVDNSAHTPIATDVFIRATDAVSEDGMGTYMTGAFMTLTNDTGHDVTLIGARSAIAPMVQIHEVVDGIMREKDGGLTIKAGTTEMLKPGGNHVMLMGMESPLAAGSEVTITLIFDDESELEVTGPVKVVNLEQEHYHSGEPTPSMSGM